LDRIFHGDKNIVTKTVGRESADYRLAEGIAWLKAEDGSSRLFDMRASTYGLNESATRMLEGVLSASMDETIRTLAAEFGTHRETIKADLGQLLQRLKNARLILARGSVPTKNSSLHHQLISHVYRLIFVICHLIFKDEPRLANIRLEASFTMLVFRFALKSRSLPEMVSILDRSLPADGRIVKGSRGDQIVDAVESGIISSVSGLLLETACKERALCGWFMLRRRRIPARLVVGVTLNPVSGHSWCQCGDRIVGDKAERCCDFTVIWECWNLDSGISITRQHHRS
jgi:hypothetical protein